MRKTRPQKIAELTGRISKTCEGYDNIIVMSALLSLATAIIADKAKNLPEAMTSAAITGLKMMDILRDRWETNQKDGPKE